MSAPYPTRVDFGDSGYVSVFPSQGRYASDIQDWASPSVLSAEVAELTALPDSEPGHDGQQLIELQWTLMLQRLTQLKRAPQDYSFQFSLVRLVSWPSLTHLPDNVLPPVARMCALLARKPSAASLLPLLLDLPETQVFMLIEVLRLFGHVQVSSTAAEPDSAARAYLPGAVADTAQARPAAPSLIAKIWQRLVNRA